MNHESFSGTCQGQSRPKLIGIWTVSKRISGLHWEILQVVSERMDKLKTG